MPKIVIILSLFFCSILPVFGEIKPINDAYCTKIVNIIYLIEGGAQTKYPFGIKSIETNGNYDKARRICVNTVKNNYIRWQKAGKTNDFVNFLADRYCPPSVDKQGNINWKRNLKYYLAK